MKKKSAKEIMNDFAVDYQQAPEGWRFWVSKSKDWFNVYIIQNDRGYFIKLDSIYSPNPVGIGAEIDFDENQLSEGDLPSFGFRRFTPEETERFLHSLPAPPKSKKEIPTKMIEINERMRRKLLKKKPVPVQPLEERGEMAVVGPYSFQSPISHISEQQRELEKKLERDLRKLRRREYPSYY